MLVSVQLMLRETILNEQGCKLEAGAHATVKMGPRCKHAELCSVVAWLDRLKPACVYLPVL